MTSAPVTASTMSYFIGTSGAATSVGTDVSNNFSETLKNQKNDGITKEQEPIVPHGRVSTRKTRQDSKLSRKEEEEISSEDITSQAQNQAEAIASMMVTKTANELGITKEEVMQLLDDLSMNPMDLLSSENLQVVVLAASGESDVCSLVTDENLFSSYKNLVNAVDDAMNQVSQATGLTLQEVKEIFDELTSEEKDDFQAQSDLTSQSLEEEQPLSAIINSTEDEAGKKTNVTGHDLSKNPTDGVGSETQDGSRILLERSLEEGSENKGNSDFTNESNPNPFAENLINQMPDAVKEAVRDTIGFFDADTEMIMNQITDYMKSQVVDGVTELDMQLHPENLGSLHVKLTSKEGVITAQFTAQNDIVKATLESQMVQLKETFKEQGVSVEVIEVLVESHRFDENLNQSNNGSMHGEDRQQTKSRGRRINLSNISDEEELTQEEALVKEMLKSNGNTVDYTA